MRLPCACVAPYIEYYCLCHCQCDGRCWFSPNVDSNTPLTTCTVVGLELSIARGGPLSVDTCGERQADPHGSPHMPLPAGMPAYEAQNNETGGSS